MSEAAAHPARRQSLIEYGEKKGEDRAQHPIMESQRSADIGKTLIDVCAETGYFAVDIRA